MSEHFNIGEWLEIKSAKIAVRTRSFMLAAQVAEKVAAAEVMRPSSVAALVIDGEREPVEYMCLEVYRARVNEAASC